MVEDEWIVESLTRSCTATPETAERTRFRKRSLRSLRRICQLPHPDTLALNARAACVQHLSAHVARVSVPRRTPADRSHSATDGRVAALPRRPFHLPVAQRTAMSARSRAAPTRMSTATIRIAQTRTRRGCRDRGSSRGGGDRGRSVRSRRACCRGGCSGGGSANAADATASRSLKQGMRITHVTATVAARRTAVAALFALPHRRCRFVCLCPLRIAADSRGQPRLLRIDRHGDDVGRCVRCSVE